MKIDESDNALVGFLFLIEQFLFSICIIPKVGYLLDKKVLAGVDKAYMNTE